MDKQELLIFMAKRAARTPALLASLIAVYCESENLTWEALAEQLGITPYQLAQMALCKRPESQTKYQIAADEIAAYAGIAPLALMRFIRQAETREAFKGKSERPSLMAAQDRPDDE